MRVGWASELDLGAAGIRAVTAAMMLEGRSVLKDMAPVRSGDNAVLVLPT
jgi:hypothetical protein